MATAKSLLMSMGTVNMWGFSPGFDMLATIPPSRSLPSAHDHGSSAVSGAAASVAATTADDSEVAEPICVLLVGPGDIRHVLATIAHRRRHSPIRPVRIYIYEKSVEVLARHFLLLQIAQDWQLPLRQRCNLFLEVFGNTRVQERTSAYIEEKAKSLIDLLHNERGLLADQLDLSHLKMRTRDDLIDTFQSWFKRVRFDVDKLRDHRLRHYYEVRYDYRNNLIDWDYTASRGMGLKKIEHASVIHIRQYREWRNSGVAFEFGDQTYTEPNRTMAAYTQAHKKHHGSVLCRGLWTDIVIGPFLSFGVHVDSPHKFAQQLFEIHNKGTGVEQNRHNTTEIAVFNVLSCLYELETGEPYTMKKAHDVYSGIGESELDQGAAPSASSSNQSSERIIELDDDAEDKYAAGSNQETGRSTPASDKVTLKQRAKEHDARQRAQTIYETFDGVTIVPLTGELDALYTKKRYARRFDHIFLSTQHSHTLLSTRVDGADGGEQAESERFVNLLADSATVSIESSVFLLPLKEDQRVLYVVKLLEMAQHHALTPTFTFANGTSTEPSSADLSKIDTAVLEFRFARASEHKA